MGIDTEKYVRKPLYVDAVRVTQNNFNEMIAWCDGELEFEETRSGSSRKFIRIDVHNPHPKNDRQKKAFVGDWILKTERGFKIYTNKAFKASFDPVVTEEEEFTIYTQADGAVITTPQDNSGVQPAGLQQAAIESGHPIDPEERIVETPEGEPAVTDSSTAPPPSHEGKRVLTVAEQETMTTEQVAEMLRAGDAILEQDLAA